MFWWWSTICQSCHMFWWWSTICQGVVISSHVFWDHLSYLLICFGGGPPFVISYHMFWWWSTICQTCRMFWWWSTICHILSVLSYVLVVVHHLSDLSYMLWWWSTICSSHVLNLVHGFLNVGACFLVEREVGTDCIFNPKKHSLKIQYTANSTCTGESLGSQVTIAETWTPYPDIFPTNYWTMHFTETFRPKTLPTITPTIPTKLLQPATVKKRLAEQSTPHPKIFPINLWPYNLKKP